jgi:hypothetical protein
MIRIVNSNCRRLAITRSAGGVRTLLYWKKSDVSSLKDSLGDRRVLLALYSKQTMAKPNPGVIQVSELRGRWPEKTSWKTQPAAADSPVSETKFEPGDGWKVFDVTPLVRSQIESNQDWHGVVLRFAKENMTQQTWSGYQFASREGAGQWKDRHPCLLVVEPTSTSENEKNK